MNRFVPAALLLLGLATSSLLFAGGQQQQFADATEISRDLLYQPAYAVDPAPGAILFRAHRFTYRFDPAAQMWQVTPEKNFATVAGPQSSLKNFTAANGKLYRFAAAGDPKSAYLEIREGPAPPPNAPKEGDPLVRSPLWTLEQLHRVWNKKDAEEAAEPEVAAVAEDGAILWLAIRFYAGEGWRGIGTIVRFDTSTNQATVLQPRALERSSLTHIALAGGFLWLGTDLPEEDSAQPTLGLVRLNPADNSVRNYPPGPTLRGGSILTALRPVESDLWVATDAGICRVALPAEQWSCWRLSPIVELARDTGVGNRSGGDARGVVAAGRYEVRWANAAFYEIVTPDAFEGWVDKEDLAEFERHEFDLSPYRLMNATAALLRVLDDPDDDPLDSSQVYRARVEKISPPAGEEAPEDMQRVRVFVGWIPRGSLQVVPALQPVTR